MVLQECTSAVGLTKKESTTEASFRTKNLDATCDVAASSNLVSRSLLIVSSCVVLILHLEPYNPFRTACGIFVLQSYAEKVSLPLEQG
jgi:hypothetical protein